MDRTKVQALLITAVIIGTVVFFVIPKPEGLFDGTKEKLTSIFTSSEKAPVKKSTPKKKWKKSNNPKAEKQIDSYQGIAVYHNGNLSSVYGRNVTKDGYNLGLRYQCVEFVKRFYYEYFGHKMPNNYGNAKEYFNYNLGDGEYNKDRGLYQYRNGSFTKPVKNAILVFDKDPSTKYGHVGIITKVTDSKVEMISQNNGTRQKTRSSFTYYFQKGKFHIKSPYIVGWLAKN